MLRLAIVFLLVAILAGVLGLWPIAGLSADFARIAFFLFLVLFLVSLLFGVARGNPPPV
jgi:uncharacterized membrane protein YtjA (UPF0391 family)